MRVRPARDGAGSLQIPCRTFLPLCRHSTLPEGRAPRTGAKLGTSPDPKAAPRRGKHRGCQRSEPREEGGTAEHAASRGNWAGDSSRNEVVSLRIEEGFVTEMMCLRRRLAAAHGAHEGVAICLSANAGEIKPIERLVRLSFTRCRASTRLLSTGWSVPALWGVLVLRRVSRLDAFSGYPGRT